MLLRCLIVFFACCSVARTSIAQSGTPITSVASTPKAAKRSDTNDARRQTDPEKYQFQAQSQNVAALLLPRADVQRELRLTEPQKMQIAALPGGDINGGLSQEGLEKVSTILSAKQLQRLIQLDYQWRGPFLLVVTPEVTQALTLTEEQNQKLLRINRQLTDSIRENAKALRQYSQVFNEKYSPQNGPLPAEVEARRKQEVAALWAKIYEQDAADILKGETQILALFTDTQKARWKELQGKPFMFQATNTR